MVESVSAKPARSYLGNQRNINIIHRLICQQNYPSAKQMAEETGVGVRTVKRYLASLRDDFHAPLKHCRRRKGYYYSTIGWAFPVQQFSEKDFLLLFLAENTLRVVGHLPEAAELKQTIGKIAAQLPPEFAQRLARYSDNLSFCSNAFEQSDIELVSALTTASEQQETVQFDYFANSTGEKTRRTADVYEVHNRGNDWYAVAYDHKRRAMRSFHIGRISNLTLTDKLFQVRTALWSREKYFSTDFQMVRGGRSTKVSIWFDPYQAQWIRNRRKHQATEQHEELPDGSLRLKFSVGQQSLEAVARFCLQYAGHCIVEKPKRLREIVQEKLRKGVDLNK